MRVGEEVHREPPAYGLTLDGLQRALGLPTAPPLAPTDELFARLWLATVIGVAAGGGVPLLGRGPGAPPGGEVLAGDPVEGADDPVAASQALGQVFDWDRLRWSAVEDKWRRAASPPPRPPGATPAPTPAG